MTNHTFIYSLKEQGSEIIRYVGKSNDPYRRLHQHIKNYGKLKGKKSNWINSVLIKMNGLDGLIF
jgi:predicted GIY-YIG superfamily endonuclease